MTLGASAPRIDTSTENINNNNKMTIKKLETRLRLQTLISKIERGGYVSMRDLKSVFGKDGVQQFRDWWCCEMSMRSLHKDVPCDFQRYIDLLHDANFARLTRRYSDEAKLCESALEALSALLQIDQSLCAWLDRPAVFDGANAIDPDIESMPRLITSKSVWGMGGKSQPLKKRAIMLRVLESALSEMTHAATSEPENMKSVTPEFLLVNARQVLNRIEAL